MSSILEIFNLPYCHVRFIAGEGLLEAQVKQCGRKAADAQEGQGKIKAAAHVSFEDEDESYNRSQPPLPPAPVPTFQDSVGEVLQSFADDSRIVIQQSPVWHDAVVEAEALHAQICGRSRRSSASAQSTLTVGAYHASVRALRRAARGLVQPSTGAPRPDVATQASPVAPRRLPNMSDYEWVRAQNVYRNERKLQSMGLPYK